MWLIFGWCVCRVPRQQLGGKCITDRPLPPWLTSSAPGMAAASPAWLLSCVADEPRWCTRMGCPPCQAWTSLPHVFLPRPERCRPSEPGAGLSATTDLGVGRWSRPVLSRSRCAAWRPPHHNIFFLRLFFIKRRHHEQSK